MKKHSITHKAKILSATLLSGGGLMLAPIAGAADNVTPSSTFAGTAESPVNGTGPQFDWSKVPGGKPSSADAFENSSLSTSSRTLYQALNWANSQLGRSIDVDGAYGAQCVDLTMAYSEYLFGTRTFGNAVDYSYYNYNGFTRLSKAQTNPQAGDIAVWTGGSQGYGHVGLVIASSGTSFTTLEQNVNGSPYVQQFSRNTYSVTDITFWGVQRPSLTNVSAIPTVNNAVYRMYNPGNGDHVYTTNKAEADNLQNAGWSYDGIPFYQAASGIQIYRVYNRYSGEHFYTSSKYEYDNLVRVGWSGEGNSWISPTAGAAVYRVYNPNGFHLWTTSSYEVNSLVAAGWRNEGVVFRG